MNDRTTEGDLIQFLRELLAKPHGALTWAELDCARETIAGHLVDIDVRSWLREMPSDVRDLPAWHLKRPETPSDDRRSRHRLSLGTQTGATRVRDEDDDRVYVSDGVALLGVDGGIVLGREMDAVDRADIAEALARPMPRSGMVTRDAIRSWLDAAVEDDTPMRSAPCVRVGDAVLGAGLIETWVWPAARLTDAPIRVAYGNDLSPVRWDGHGWTAMMAPRLCADQSDKFPALVVSHA